jgi:GAF domain-containing protein
LQDDRFDQAVDAETGYRTHSILCGPIQDRTGKVIGVLQAINKRGQDGAAVFTSSDEEILSNLAQQVHSPRIAYLRILKHVSQAGIILQNAALFTESQQARERVRRSRVPSRVE